MSAKDAMASMLDELMGPRRNAELGNDTTVTFDDPDICKYYLVGFCPHDMFINTKCDLGVCPKVHDDNLRREYPTSKQFEKLGFEREFLRFLIKLEEENGRRIKRNLEKLKNNEETGEKRQLEKKQREMNELEALEKQLAKIMEEADQAASSGNVALCQSLVEKTEELHKRKSAVGERVEALNKPITVFGSEFEKREMEVCETCGSTLIKNDAQCRVEEHLTGKMHMGFSKIKVTIEELQRRLKELDEKNEAERQKDRAERSSRTSREDDRSKDRKRSKSRDRERDRRKRSRSRSRDRRRSRDRKSRDRRSRSRDRRSRSRDRRSRSRSRDRRSDRDRDRRRR